MPKIREITTIINNALKAGNFSSRPFQTGVWATLATITSRVEGVKDNEVIVKRPAVFNLQGEGTDVSPDDTAPIQFYHRLLSPLQYPDLSKDNDSFGNPNHDNREIAEMVLICIGDSGKLKVFAEDVCAAICADIPKELAQTDKTALNLETCAITINDTNTNTEQVFTGEFTGVDFILPESMFMIAVRYTITTMFSKTCLTLCQ